RTDAAVINLEAGPFTIVLLDGDSRDQIRREGLFAAMVIDKYPLSDEEALAAFEVLPPREARVDGPLKEQLSRAEPKIESGQRLALIRWSDNTESLVGFSAAHTAPSSELLKSAYRNGYAARRLSQLLAAKGNPHGQC